CRCRPPRPPRSILFPYTTLFRSGHYYFTLVQPGVASSLQGPALAVRSDRRRDFRGIFDEQPAARYMDTIDRLDGDRLGGLFWIRSEEHTSELQSRSDLVCRLLLE